MKTYDELRFKKARYQLDLEHYLTRKKIFVREKELLEQGMNQMSLEDQQQAQYEIEGLENMVIKRIQKNIETLPNKIKDVDLELSKLRENIEEIYPNNQNDLYSSILL